MLIEIPALAGKTDLKELVGIPKREYSGKLDQDLPKALYSFSETGLTYDFLLVRKPDPINRLFVIFSGAAVGAHLTPPVFQRWRWADKFPGHCLYISDPTIRLAEELNLAWYAGTPTQEPMSVIAALVLSITEQLGLASKNVFSYGSSGGGYAALRLGAFMCDIGIVAINPQIDITKYEFSNVERFLRICFDGISRDQAGSIFPHKMCIASHIESLRSTRIVYVQNVLDKHHLEVHQPIFINALRDASPASENVHYIDFSLEGGHGKAESSEVFTQIMEKIASY